jgi:hypothetical protein
VLMIFGERPVDEGQGRGPAHTAGR